MRNEVLPSNSEPTPLEAEAVCVFSSQSVFHRLTCFKWMNSHNFSHRHLCGHLFWKNTRHMQHSCVRLFHFSRRSSSSYTERVFHSGFHLPVCWTVRKPRRLNAANMPKCWRTRSLWMATRLWASRRRSTANSWPGWGRTPGWWRRVWWRGSGSTRNTPKESSTPSSPHFMATVSCRRTRATCCRCLTFFAYWPVDVS